MQSGSADGARTIVITQEPPPKTLVDPSLYAPGVPAVLVALFVLFAGDRLTRRRERRKEVWDLCNELNDRADEAVESAVRAWTESSKTKRPRIIMEARRRFKTVGVTATDLHRITSRPLLFRTLWRPWADRRRNWAEGRKVIVRTSIDVSGEVVALRRTAMQDPFDDPGRNASSLHLPAMNDALGNLSAAISRHFHRLYR